MKESMTSSLKETNGERAEIDTDKDVKESNDTKARRREEEAMTNDDVAKGGGSSSGGGEPSKDEAVPGHIDNYTQNISQSNLLYQVSRGMNGGSGEDTDPVKEVGKGGEKTSVSAKKKRKSKGKKDQALDANLEGNDGLKSYVGVVVVRQDGFGFIKSPALESRVYFHVKDSDKKCHNGSEVEFSIGIDGKTKKKVAKCVKTISGPVNEKQAKPIEEHLPGEFTGTVHSVPRSSHKIHIDDGMISFVDMEGKQQQAMFGNWRFACGDDQISHGAPVQFNLAQNTTTKVFKALNVRLDVEAMEAAQNARNACVNMEDDTPQLGKIALLKKEFGFIKRLNNPSDLFFHFTEFDSSMENPQVGDEVSFYVSTDSQGRKCATNVTRAPAGSVQFELLSNEVYYGVVVEKPSVSKSYQKTVGIIDFLDHSLHPDKVNLFSRKDMTKPMTKLLFQAQDSNSIQQLRAGDLIFFRILTDVAAMNAALSSEKASIAKLIGRRAARVQPIQLTGTLVDVSVEKKYGFILWDGILPVQHYLLQEKLSGTGLEGGEYQQQLLASFNSSMKAQERIFFYASELHDPSSMEVGDRVSFVLHKNPKTGDLNASRINLVSKKKAPEHKEAKIVENPKPHKRVIVGNAAHHQVQGPKGPDGTRGFGMGRGSHLQSPKDLAAPGSEISSMFAGLRLRGIFPEMNRSLSVEAAPFVPPVLNPRSVPQ